MRTLPITRDELAEELYELEVELDEFDIRPEYGYSYGSTCLGVVCSTFDTALVILALTARLSQEDTIDVARAQRIDNMGRSLIVYFPGFKLQD